MELDLRCQSLVPLIHNTRIFNSLRKLPPWSPCQTFDTSRRHRSNAGDPIRSRISDLTQLTRLTVEGSQNVPLLHNANEKGI